MKSVAHFIGGPMDGHTEESEPSDIIYFADIMIDRSARYKRDWSNPDPTYHFETWVDFPTH